MDSCNVQHLNKKSSDELLRKFAELESPGSGIVRKIKRRKSVHITVRLDDNDIDQCDSGGTRTGIVLDRKSLISPATRNKKSVVLLKKLGIGRSQHLRISNKSILGAFQKTWRRTVEGASRVLLEKHYNAHRRLINDIV